MKKLIAVGALALAGASSFACDTAIDPVTGLQLESVSTGWRSVGVVDGMNKLVPSVSFKLKNGSDRSLPSLQVNAVVRRIGEGGEWGSASLTAAGTDGPAPGALAGLSVEMHLGYTGTA